MEGWPAAGDWSALCKDFSAVDVLQPATSLLDPALLHWYEIVEVVQRASEDDHNLWLGFGENEDWAPTNPAGMTVLDTA